MGYGEGLQKSRNVTAEIEQEWWNGPGVGLRPRRLLSSSFLAAAKEAASSPSSQATRSVDLRSEGRNDGRKVSVAPTNASRPILTETPAFVEQSTLSVPPLPPTPPLPPPTIFSSLKLSLSSLLLAAPPTAPSELPVPHITTSSSPNPPSSSYSQAPSSMPFTANGSNPAPEVAAPAETVVHASTPVVAEADAPDHSRVQHYIGKSCELVSNVREGRRSLAGVLGSRKELARVTS